MAEIEDIDTELSPSKSGRRSWTVVGLIIVLIAILIGGVWMFRSREPGQRPVAQTSSMNTGELMSALKQQQAEVERLRDREKKSKETKKIRFVELYSQLTGDELTQVLKELSFDEIAFKTEQKGKFFTVFVDETYVEDAKNKLAKKGLPMGGIKGYEIFDNASNMGVTDFDKRIRFIRAITGELEKAILQIDGIADVKVQIVMPEQRLFSTSQPPVTAAILLRHDNKPVTDEKVYSIIQLVTGAVENLDPKRVSVVDTEGRVLSAGVLERMVERRRKRLERIQAGLAVSGTHIRTSTQSIVVSQSVTASVIPIGLPARITTASAYQEWWGVKQSVERDLEKKVVQQLAAILPKDQFVVSVVADVRSINKALPGVKQVAVSVVVKRESDIQLDATKKHQIFAVVSNAIGYVPGRDRIHLTRGNAIVKSPVRLPSKIEIGSGNIQKVVSAAPKIPTAHSGGHVASRFLPKLSIPRVSPVVWGGLVLLAIIGGGIVIFLRRRKRPVELSAPEPTVDDQKNQLIELAKSDPAKLAAVFNKWLSADMERVNDSNWQG